MTNDSGIEIVLSSIQEKDADFAIIRSFCDEPKVRELFFKQINRSGKLFKVYHSKSQQESDGHMGESDIIFILNDGNKKFAIFIEDKIAANPQPNQSGRYKDRANLLGDEEGFGREYFVFLCAPKQYIESEKSAGYDHFVSYENIVNVLPNDSFDGEILNFALKEKSKGYVLIKNDKVTSFWMNLANKYVPENYPDLKMPKVTGPKPSKSVWPTFKSGIKNVSIIWKSDQNCVDLEFSGANKPEHKTKFLEKISKIDCGTFMLSETGESISLSASYSSIYKVDFKKDFMSQINNINVALNLALELRKLCNEIMKANLGFEEVLS